MKLLSTDNILEVAVHSYRSALAAQNGGADRIELCTALQTGGLTPDIGLTQLIIESISLPVHILIRPRLGNFIYDKYEFKTVIRTIEQCSKWNVHGVVAGCLKHDGSIHQEQLRQMKDAAGSLDITFHRAIDVCTNIYETLDMLMQYKFDRVLTSGRSPSAWDGRNTIRKMINYTQHSQLTIMPGAGITCENADVILDETGATEIHASAKREFPLDDLDPIGLTHIHGKPFNSRWESDEEEIRQLKAKISNTSR